MKGTLDGPPPSEIFALGHDFEPAMASIWKRRNPGWQLSPGEVQYIVPADRFGYPAAVTLIVAPAVAEPDASNSKQPGSIGVG